MTIRDTFDFAQEAIGHALGEDVTYTAQEFAEETITAVFGSGFERVQSGDIRISSRRPEISVRLDEFTDIDADAEPRAGDVVEIRGREFEVANVKPDVEDVSATLVLKATD